MIKFFAGLLNQEGKKTKPKTESLGKKFDTEIPLDDDGIKSLGDGRVEAVFNEFCRNELEGYDEEQNVLRAVCFVDFRNRKLRVSVKVIERTEYMHIDDDGIGILVDSYPNSMHNIFELTKAEYVIPKMYWSMERMLFDYRDECHVMIEELRNEIEGKILQEIKDTTERYNDVDKLIQGIVLNVSKND